MRIEDTHIQQASRQHVEGHGKKDGLKEAKERHDHHHHHHDGVHRHKRPDVVAISDEARARFESMHKRSEKARGHDGLHIPEGVGPAGLIGRLIHKAFGGHGLDISDIARAGRPQAAVQPVPEEGASSSGFSASIEQLSLSASGTIKTADGEEVGFTLELNVTKASMSGFSSGPGDAQNPLTVDFEGSSSELFSMSFKFNVASGEETGTDGGTGLLSVDNGKENPGEAEKSDEDATSSLVSSVPDFLKALRRADFTSTYFSFSQTTIEASTYSAIAEGAPLDSLIPGAPASNTPIDLVA
jgi:hypothetical protein